MVFDFETFAAYDLHKDDPVFLEHLLNNYTAIIDSKEGSEKILYAGEIARLLGRVATQERCKADYEQRSRDDDKYIRYYKTALFVARMGIDIGVNQGYDAFEKGEEVPDIEYNHYMGWIYIHYSMILLENHRYFAAMTAITLAENHLIHDLYHVLTNGHLEIILERIKKIPEYEKIPFKSSEDQKQARILEALTYLTGGLQDAIIEKKLRVLIKIYKEVPRRYMDFYAGQIFNHLAYFLKKNPKKYSKDFAETIQILHKEYPTKPEKYLDLPDLTLRDVQKEQTIDEKSYTLWVVSCNLALSYLDFVPDINCRLKYISDDLIFDFNSQKLNIMMEDVLETYAHCRAQVFSATHYHNPMGELAYCLSPKAERIFNQELLLDVYPRLYSVLDKISHIIMKICGVPLSPNRDGYIPQPSYNLIVQEIQKKSDGNPYLQTMCDIFAEINPRFIYRTQKDQPFYAMLPDAIYMDKLRHHIIHSGVSLTVNSSGKKSDNDMAYISEREFADRCYDMLRLVKEAIMNTCLAIEYRNRQD